MSPETKTRSLSIVSFGLIAVCFVLLLEEVVLTRQQWQEIPRILAGLLAPVPLALFLAFCFAHRSGPEASTPGQAPVLGVLVLLAGIVAAVLLGLFWSAGKPDSVSLGSGPVIAQSSLLTASVLNLLFLRNTLVAAALSGLSVGLVVFVIFLT